jgi:hypothetical protein
MKPPRLRLFRRGRNIVNIDWNKVPKAALDDTLRFFKQHTLSSHTKADLVEIAGRFLCALDKNHQEFFALRLDADAAYHMRVKIKKIAAGRYEADCGRFQIERKVVWVLKDIERDTTDDFSTKKEVETFVEENIHYDSIDSL